MTSEDNGFPESSMYKLTCTNCTFETTVEGNATEALEVADTHQDEHGEAASDHFVNLERTNTPE